MCIRDSIFAGQVESRCDFGLACEFFVALAFHQLVAGEAEFHPGEAMDTVVDTPVVGHIAAGHAAVGCVDDGIAAKGRDVALPEIESFF